MPEPTGEPTTQQEPAAAPAPATAPTPAIGLTADLVRNSPEYLALQAQNRELARRNGTAEAAIAAARAEAETIRQTAEAERTRALNEQLSAELGEEGLSFWNRFAELSATDPVAAARELKAFQQRAQSPAGTPPTPPAAAPTAPTGEPTVPANGTGARPPMASAMHADLPLGSIAPQNSDEELLTALDGRFQEIVARNNNVNTRNRVTAKEREEGIMAHFVGGVIRSLKANGVR